MSWNKNNNKKKSKKEIVNTIFFKRKHKILIDNNKDINQFYKLILEEAINNDKYFISSKYYLSVKKCQLLYCVLIINNEIDIEFENGKILNPDKEILQDKELEEKLVKLVENETEKIREKLNLALSINENILSLGYCMDIELIKNVALYDEKQMKNFSIFLPAQIKTFIENNKIKNYKNYEPEYPNFPDQHIPSEIFYFYYCKWLYGLEHASTDTVNPTSATCDTEAIPSSYKLIFKNIQALKSNPLYQFLFTHFFKDDLKFTIISLGEKREYYQMITDRMSSPTPFDAEDIADLGNFIKYEKHHLDYIPSEIPNKYNLGQISKLLFDNNKEKSQKDFILPRFKDPVVDDVLNLALIYNNQSMAYNSRKDLQLNYFQIELLIELLKYCPRRYYEFIKKRTQWMQIFNLFNRSMDNFDKEYPDLYAEKGLMDKYFDLNSIFLNRSNKMIMYEEEENPLNHYFKTQLEKALKTNERIFNSKKYNLTVKECNFIHCILTLNDTVDLEYENAKCIRGANAITDDSFMETLNSVIEEETDLIREKLKYPLILIENLADAGYVLSPEFVQTIAFYDKFEIYELAIYLLREHKNIPSNIKYDDKKIVLLEKNKNKKEEEEEEEDEDDFSDSDFEQLNHDDDSDDQEEEEMEKYISDAINEKVDPFYYHYCKWLYYVEKSIQSRGENLDRRNLPLSYKENKKVINKIKKNDKNNTLQWDIIHRSGEEEFYQMIREMFVSPTMLPKSDINYLKEFMETEEDYWNYIAQEIPNKNNLAQIISVMYEYDLSVKISEYEREDRDFFTSDLMKRVESLFHKVNEVLLLIIYMANDDETDVEALLTLPSVQNLKVYGENRIKFIFRILDHCDATTRYEDFMQYQLIWSRFCDTIDHQALKLEHKAVIEDLLSVAKDYTFRSILFRRRNKLIVEKKEGQNLDSYYKTNLETALQKDRFFSAYPQFHLQVKECHLLYCALTLTLNNNQPPQEIKFENGKLFTEPPAELTAITIEIETTEGRAAEDEENRVSDQIDDEKDKGDNNDASYSAQDDEVMKVEETLMDHLKEIVEIETKKVREKLNLVLSLNENVYAMGSIMEIDLIEILALYTPYELEELSTFFIKQMTGTRGRLPFPKFPNMYLDIKKAFYSSYCKWLYRLERIFHCDETVIPMSFKKFLFRDEKNFNTRDKSSEKVEEEGEGDEKDGDNEDNEDNDEENDDNGDMEDENEDKEDSDDKQKDDHELEEDKKMKRKRIKYEMNIDINDAGLKIVMLGEKEEFYQTIYRIMAAPEAGNANDLSNMKNFIQFEKDHMKYIPETITNKENLANIVHILLEYYKKEPLPEKAIVSLFKNVNDVLRLGLVLSGHSASDLGKPQRFKSFSNQERRLFMKLLDHCGGDRYDDFIKYHSVWARFFEKIHPMKFKALYPDLIEDLLGTYRFIGDPENKRLRMEYSFYQLLLKLNERLVKYREDTLKLIQHKEPVPDISHFMYLYGFNTSMEHYTQFFNLEFLDQEDPSDTKNPTVNYQRVDEKDLKMVRTIVKNIRINKVLTARDLPLTKIEHEKIMEKYHNLDKLSEEMKNYLYPYLQCLVSIFSGGLTALNDMFQKNWDSCYREGVSETYYQEYVQALKKNSHSLYSTVIPVLNVDFIQKRMNEILPLLLQLQKRARKYKQERQTFNSKWVELISKKKFEEAAQVLARKPGVFLRQLDELITKSERENEKELILKLFEEVASKTSIKVLLSMKGYFQKRMKTLKGRAFLIQGGLKDKKKKSDGNDRIINLNRGVVTQTHTVIYYTTKVKKPLDESMCDRIVRICDEALINNFQTKSKLSRVYISPDIQNFLIPYDLRSAKKANGKMCSKGSRFSIKFKEFTEEYREKVIEDLERKLEKNRKKLTEFMEKKGQFEVKYINHGVGLPSNRMTKRLKFMEKKLEVLKSVVQKNEEELDNMKNYTPDSTYNYIRLYVVGTDEFSLELFDEDLQLKRMYPTLKKYNQIRFGHRYNDKDSDDGEIFYYNKEDVIFYDIDLVKVVQQGIRYIAVNIECADDIKFGWMERRALNSSEKFNPEKHHQSFTFSYDQDACPLILDCKTCEFIWVDKEFDQSYFPNNFKNILQHMEDRDKDTTAELQKIEDEEERQKYLKQLQRNQKCYEHNLKIKHSLFYYYLEPLKISINDLIQLHIRAREGTQVATEEELEDGDLAFLASPPLQRKDNVHYIFYHQHDTILTNYMSLA